MTLRRGLLRAAGAIAVDPGLVAWWTFDNTPNDFFNRNNLTLSGTSYVSDGDGGTALSTGTAGYAQNSSITSDLKTTQGTLEIRMRRSDPDTSSFVSFSTCGGVSDEIRIDFLPSGNGYAAQIVVSDAGVVKIAWLTNTLTFSDTSWFDLRLTADGSGTAANGFRMWKDGVENVSWAKGVDISGYRGIWVGGASMAAIDALTFAGICRATTVLPGNLDFADCKLYDYVKTS